MTLSRACWLGLSSGLEFVDMWDLCHPLWRLWRIWRTGCCSRSAFSKGCSVLLFCSLLSSLPVPHVAEQSHCRRLGGMSGGRLCLDLNISIHSPFGKHPLLSYCSDPCIPTLQSNLFPNLLQFWGLHRPLKVQGQPQCSSCAHRF